MVYVNALPFLVVRIDAILKTSFLGFAHAAPTAWVPVVSHDFEAVVSNELDCFSSLLFILRRLLTVVSAPFVSSGGSVGDFVLAVRVVTSDGPPIS